VREHNESQTTFLVICSGAFVTARSGIYEGRHVTGPRVFLPVLKKEFPTATWDDSVRVVQDGHIWTGGMYQFLLTRKLFLIREMYCRRYHEWYRSCGRIFESDFPKTCGGDCMFNGRSR
jgi:transcriptional regulator GlxA family with amidase domain